jgi:thioredoxin-like negative regulator of GroEL
MSDIHTLTQFDFYQTLEQTEGLRLVYFSAQACSSCQHLHQLLSKLATNEPLTVYKVDAGDDPGLATEYEIFHLPALFLFNNGQYHAELKCEARIPSILAAIHQASQQPAEEAP